MLQKPVKIEAKCSQETASALSEKGHLQKWAVNYWLDAGLDESQLVVGISFNGAAYELKDGRVLGFWAPQTGAAPEGKYTKKEGRLSYYEASMGTGHYLFLHWWHWLTFFNVIRKVAF